MERTLALVKPDAVAKGAANEVIALIELKGLTVLGKAQRQLSKDQAESFYAEHRGKPFFAGLIDFMTSGPVVALALAGVGAIKAWRDMMGPTNTAHARAEAPRSLRALYGTDGTRNAMHGSDSEASASREIKFFFPSLQPETAPDAAAFIEAQLQQVLTVGLTALSKSKPGTPAAGVRQLAHWLLENNPNAARRVEPGSQAASELDGGEVDGVDETIARAERKAAAAKVKSEHNLARRSTQAVLDIQEKSIVEAKAALAHVESTHDVGAAERGFTEELRARQRTADAFKAAAAVDWLPEYHPASIVPPGESKDTIVERVTRVSLASILTSVPCGRKTKIVATLGPSCWSEEGLSNLLDAGLNVARFNFSHGSHEAHQEVLDRLRKVAAAKRNLVAFLLDTKGPEIRTAMLRGGKDIHLTKGQELTIYAAGDEYTTWEGFKDEATGETKIGISYAKLCQSVKPGNVILIADGAISIEVLQVLSERELRGRVINSYKLGQRKNCNLPGVHVDLPVLAAKDIDDVQNFACKNDMDFIAASFVQSVEDVRMIRRVLTEAGKPGIRIISKIENEAGLRNIDAIVAESDGIMVARGDLAMEVPAEKIALCQKMIIEKCNRMGKIVITATQMLESMIENPLPTRAEMTDVANAVIDGTHAVMLSGETANGKFPDTAVRTMAAIAENAELAVDAAYQFDHIRNSLAARGPISSQEATLAGVVREAVSFTLDENGDGVLDATEGCVAVLLTDTGSAAEMLAKYHPPCPVIVVSTSETVLRKCSVWFGLYPLLVEDFKDVDATVARALEYAKARKLAFDGKNVIIVSGFHTPSADSNAQMTVEVIGASGEQAAVVPRASTAYTSPFQGNATFCLQMLRISPELIINKVFNFRSTKVIATLGPSSWLDEQLSQLLDGGVSMVRVNLAIPNLDYKDVIGRFRRVAKARRERGGHMFTSHPAILATIKGPEIRTTMLRDNAPIELKAGGHVFLMGADTSFEGHEDTSTGEVFIGISYPHLAASAAVGDTILLEEGTLKLQVEAVQGDVLKCVVLTGGIAKPQRLVDLCGKRVDLPFLSTRDLSDLVFVCEQRVDFVSLPFVTSAKDIMAARDVLDKHGGEAVKIIAQVDNALAIQNYDAILEAADGIMISRGNLGMRIPAEKICLAQKWMSTKANLAGKPVIVAAQMLETMVASPRPTRAEMTDVANATYDGADAILLRNETSKGQFVQRAVETAAAILKDAEVGVDHYSSFNYLRNFTPKPMPNLEAVCSSAVKAAVDMSAMLLCIVTDTCAPIRALAKYRPGQVIVVATTQAHVAQQCNLNYGAMPLLLPATVSGLEAVKDAVVQFARAQGLAQFVKGDSQSDQLIMVCSKTERPFMTNDDLSQVQFMTMVVGDEASAVQRPSGYRGSDTIAYRSTKVGLDLVCSPIDSARKTKIICTLGPQCWSEEGLTNLLDAGMNVARFNFSHGAHSDHQVVLDRVQKVAAAKSSSVALMLDTKGPEVRTAMLKDHKPIELVEGQEVTIVAVGDTYTTWEGFKDEATGETRIGLSYAKLCKDVKIGGRILIGDGTIVVEVLRILSDTELVARCLNSKKLGERKNCNLPGVKVDIPVLTPKDVDDLQQFCCRNKMDFVAASFVQSADDVRFIRKTLDEAGGHGVQIISKIESSHGLINFDDILAESDGIMVARGDLAMEIPSWKVPLAQKMMITKANIAGKFIVTATQMLESMIENPLPTRAEMTDVANAVWDGTDAVMLSGETANGAFSVAAVQTMAAIASNAEVGVNYYQNFDFIRDFTDKPMSTVEAVVSCAAKDAIDVDATLIVVFTSNGHNAQLVSKYRPRVPVLVVTDSVEVTRLTSPRFAQYPFLVDKLPGARHAHEFNVMLERAIIAAMEGLLCEAGKQVIVVHGTNVADSEVQPMCTIKVAPGTAAPRPANDHDATKTLSLRSMAISLNDVLNPVSAPRKTKIVCTLGPSCWSEEGLAKLLDAGMNVARFNFSHGAHADHQEVLDRLRKVAAAKGRRIAYLLDTKGPEVRTAMVRDGKNIDLVAGQEVTLVAVGADYDKWEGFKDAATGETKIGISYAKLCQSVKPGNRILIADGTLSIEVLAILNERELRGRCLNSKSLGPRKNCNLPGVKVDIPVLTPKDVDDLQQFCCRNKMDFVAASFVQSADDVRFIRKTLDDAGGHDIKIISKIENESGMDHYDAILAEGDGIMVARGDLAMEIPSWKVALAQKMMITKANIAGKFIVTATQMLESMIGNPLPTRAEMTDVANACFDGTDAVMLSGETANGKFPDTAVRTMAAIVSNAENSNGYVTVQCFLRDHSSKPFSRLEAFGATVAAAIGDCGAGLVVVLSKGGAAARMVSKYRAHVPQVVVTPRESVANQSCVVFGQYALHAPEYTDVEVLIQAAKQHALAEGIWDGASSVIVLHGKLEPSADTQPVISVL